MRPPESQPDEAMRRVAEAVRAACLRAAKAGYEQAAMSGLCGEGAWEVAVGAVAALDLDEVLRAEALARASAEEFRDETGSGEVDA